MFLLLTAFAPVLRHQDPLRGNLRLRMLPPTWTMSAADLKQHDLGRFSYPMGTDALGRDILTRVLYGGRISLRVGLEAVLMAAALGTLLGLIAGYFGGWLDTFIVWFVDILLAFPGILLAIAIVAALGQSLLNALIAISITYVPVYIRIVRSVALGLRQSESSSRQGPGLALEPDHRGARPAQRPLAPHGAVHPLHRHGHPGRGRPRLPWARRSAPVPRVGRLSPTASGASAWRRGCRSSPASPSSSRWWASTSSATPSATCSTRA